METADTEGKEQGVRDYVMLSNRGRKFGVAFRDLSRHRRLFRDCS
jgi:hypothetical protein